MARVELLFPLCALARLRIARRDRLKRLGQAARDRFGEEPDLL